MRTRKTFMAMNVRSVLLGVGLGTVLFSVTGKFFFVIVAGAAMGAGIAFGRFLQHMNSAKRRSGT